MEHVNVCILPTGLFLPCFFLFYISLVFALLSLVKEDICCLGLQNTKTVKRFSKNGTSKKESLTTLDRGKLLKFKVKGGLAGPHFNIETQLDVKQ